jgi:phosphinothricin acetyltransferase
MLFREATIDDLPVIVEIYNATIPSQQVTADTHPVSVDSKIPWYKNHNTTTRPLWVVEEIETKKVIGWFSLQDFYGRPAYEGTAEFSLYITSEKRSKGVGKKTLNFLIEKCPSLGIHTLLGFIFEQNESMLALCLKMGFKEWGHLHNVALFEDQFCSLKILGLKINP